MSGTIAQARYTESFPVNRPSILSRIDAIDPIAYSLTRNVGDGAVTALSPYISRGVISTKIILERLLENGFNARELTPYIQQMAWREYFQRVWQNTEGNLLGDLKNPQMEVEHSSMPEAVLNGRMGIRSVDEMIETLRRTGYIHNHYRMYLASIVCNVGRAHWLLPARWMYYHLLDADWASNACSWQWVAGAFSSKKYWVNQENINRYSRTNQALTFLDFSYKELPEKAVPEILKTAEMPKLHSLLPESDVVELDPELPTLVYTFHNLDPLWRASMQANRVLILEPSFFLQFPVSPNTLNFVSALAREIDGLCIFSGEWNDLFGSAYPGEIYFKEHPTNDHFSGIQDERDWLFPEVTGFHPSFFSYWKKCEKVLAKLLLDRNHP